MTYRIAGLPPEPFAPLFAMSDEELAGHRAKRVVADAGGSFPCRVSLEDAAPGEELILVHHVHHDVESPYRSAFAIFVREQASEAADYRNACPPAFEGRTLSLRAFDEEGSLAACRLAAPGSADAGIRDLFADPRIAYINAHNAAAGCFAARIERDGQ